MKKFIVLLTITFFIIALILFTTNPYYWIDLFTKEETIDIKEHGRYIIDTNGLREFEINRTQGYKYLEKNEPFTYFLQLPLDKDILDTVSRDLQLELPNELLDYIYSSEVNYEYMLLSIGRELKEIKYKYLSYFSDGVNAKAEITFEEQPQNNLLYVYFIDKNVYFWRKSYYVMDEEKRVFFGNNLYYAYN